MGRSARTPPSVPQTKVLAPSDRSSEAFRAPASETPQAQAKSVASCLECIPIARESQVFLAGDGKPGLQLSLGRQAPKWSRSIGKLARRLLHEGPATSC